MMISGGSDLILHLLFDDEKQISWGLVAARFCAPLATYSTGVASGMFAPGLAAGRRLVRKSPQLTHAANANFIILLGMIAFLSGVTRAPFTSFVLVMEMTDRHSAIFAMMVASLVASLAAKIIDSKSFYERSAARLIRTLPKSAQPKRRKKAVAGRSAADYSSQLSVSGYSLTFSVSVFTTALGNFDSSKAMPFSASALFSSSRRPAKTPSGLPSKWSENQRSFPACWSCRRNRP
jgi:hypothetical protein